MAVYVFHCPDCGATSPEFSNRGNHTRVTRHHVCGQTCAHCGWRRGHPDCRGLCRTCYGNLDIRNDYPSRHGIPADILLEEWALLRSEGHTLRQAAERLGITFAALDKALCRAKRRGDPRATRRAA